MDPQRPKRGYTLLEVVDDLCELIDEEQNDKSRHDEPDQIQL